MKKIISLSIVLLFGIGSIAIARTTTYRRLNSHDSNTFRHKCAREGRVSRVRIDRSFDTYQNNVSHYRGSRKHDQSRHRRNLVNSYKTLEGYCPNTARRMLRD